MSQPIPIQCRITIFYDNGYRLVIYIPRNDMFPRALDDALSFGGEHSQCKVLRCSFAEEEFSLFVCDECHHQ
ncbi:hypothetical protein Avbf_11739 [Armadillidium vulgare]|nr:hypothetical protein Avbf_11739 [Armadillidium vulgare]